MAIISICLNEEEEKIIELLTTELNIDKSSLIRASIREIYEDYIDNKFIDEYEKNPKQVKFFSAEDILSGKTTP